MKPPDLALNFESVSEKTSAKADRVECRNASFVQAQIDICFITVYSLFNDRESKVTPNAVQIPGDKAVAYIQNHRNISQIGLMRYHKSCCCNCLVQHIFHR